MANQTEEAPAVFVEIEGEWHEVEVAAEKLHKMNLKNIDTILVKGFTVSALRIAYGPGLFNEQFQTQVGFNVEKKAYIIVRTNNKNLKVGDVYKKP